MRKYYVPANKPEDWQPLLDKPDKQWKTGYSAKHLSGCWQEADDFPRCVQQVFEDSTEDVFRHIRLLVSLPDYKIPWPEGIQVLQDETFFLAKGNGQLVGITVEEKISESLGVTVNQWAYELSVGENAKLRYFCQLLGIEPSQIGDIPYQLILRAAPVIIFAREFGATKALILVHSFNDGSEGFEDHSNFCQSLSTKVGVNSLVYARTIGNVSLFLAWVRPTPEVLLECPSAQCIKCLRKLESYKYT